MAKNKVEIDVKVDDKGSTKKVELGANKAAEGLEKVANRSRTADRNIKGVAATSSSATKNFSKMSQGVGGLVGAYATFAATMFAVSAVFQFFKSAADLQELQTGQELYARHTGLAIRSLSLDIIEATNNQIGFKDASQAAAIGLSSGLNVEQLKKLGQAAKGASAVLGRDVPDSFNRLIRGATKAEPELLDELGIILRLEDAKKRYALETGKQAQSLTAFEEKQAVTNEIIRQAEEKYLSATAGATGLGNSVQKLATVLQNDLLNPFMNVVAALATPIFDILADNIYALAAAMAGLAAPLIRTITGVAGAAGDAAKEAHKEAVKQADKAKAAHAEYATEVESQEKRLQNTYQKSRDVAAGQVAGLNSRKGSHVEILKSGKDLNDKQIAAMKLNVLKKNGIYSAMNDTQRGDLVKTLGEMQLANKGATMSIQAQWSLTGMKLKLTFKSIAAAWKGLMSGMVLAAGFAATAINILLGAVSWIGLIVTGITLVAAGVGAVVDYFKSDATKEAEATQEKINQKIEDTINSVRSVREELDKAYDGVKPIADQFKAAAKAGNSLASIDLAGLTLLEGQGAAGNKDAQKEAEAMVNTIKTILRASGTAFGDIEKDINGLTVRTAQTLIPQLLAKNKLIQEAAQSLEKADEAFTSAMQQDSQSGKYTTEITALIQARDNLVKMQETVSLDADQAKALKRVEKNLQFLKSIRDIDSDIANKRRLSNLEFEESIVNVSKSTRQILGFNKKQADIGLTMEQTRREIANLETKQKENAGIFSDLEKRNLKQKKQKLEDLDRELATSKKIQAVQMEEAKHAAIMEGLKRTDKLVNLKKIDVYATKSRKDEVAHQDKVAKNQTKRVDLERTKNIAEERHNTAVARL